MSTDCTNGLAPAIRTTHAASLLLRPDLSPSFLDSPAAELFAGLHGVNTHSFCAAGGMGIAPSERVQAGAQVLGAWPGVAPGVGAHGRVPMRLTLFGTVLGLVCCAFAPLAAEDPAKGTKKDAIPAEKT